MRKLIVLSLAVLFCLPLAVYASSIGGAETQGQGKFAIGLDQEFVFDRDLKLLDFGTTDERDKTEIDSAYRTMVKASYGVLDNLDIYVKLGTADFKRKSTHRTRYSATDWDDDTAKLKGENALAYGIGMKGKYDFENNWIIGCDIQYLGHKNNLKGTDTWITRDDPNRTGVDTLEGKATFQEWHIAPYIAKKIGNFVPYLGVRYSDLRQNYKEVEEDGDSKIKFKADDNVGVFVGTDYKIGKNVSLNLEGRFIDETAISLGTTYKF